MTNTPNKNVYIVTLTGKLTTQTEINDFNTQVRLLKEQDIKWIVINLQALDWMDSAGLGALISCYTTIRNTGGDVRFSNLNPKLQHLFNLTKLNHIFQIYSTVDAAIHSYFKTAN